MATEHHQFLDRSNLREQEMSALSHKIVVSRKPSTCFGCAMEYPAGTRMQRIAWKFDDNKIETTSYCPTCLAYWNQYMDVHDEIEFGELRRDDPESWLELQQRIGES